MADLHTLRVAVDLPCLRCKYDLRGLHADGRCPECGLELIESIAARVDPELMDLPPLPRPRLAAWSLLVTMLALTSAVLAQSISYAAIAITALPPGTTHNELSRWLPATTAMRLVEIPPTSLGVALIAAFALLVAIGRRGWVRVCLLVGITGWIVASLSPVSARALAISGVPAALSLFALSPILRELGRRSRTYRARHTARQSIGPLESAIALGVASYASAAVLESFVGPDATTPLRLIAIVCTAMTVVGFLYLLANAIWMWNALARWQPLLERVMDRGGAPSPAERASPPR